MEGSGHGLSEVLSHNLPGGTEGNYENLNQGSRSPVRDLKPEPPE
jgi:hypothetical protein